MKLKKVYNALGVINESKATQGNIIKYDLRLNVSDGKFKVKGNGTLRVPVDVSKSIICIEDVINFIINEEVKSSSGVQNHSGVTSKDILSQMLFAFLDKDSAKYLTTKDEILFSFDYGSSENNCVGILISKAIGSPSFSIIMRLNQKALPNAFNKQAVDSQILSFSSVGDTNG